MPDFHSILVVNDAHLIERIREELVNCTVDDWRLSRDLNYAITRLIGRGKVDEAVALVKVWEEFSPLRLNVYLCTTMIHLFSVANNMEMVIKILEKSKGLFIPNALTARSLLIASVKKEGFNPNNVIKSYEILRSLGCQPAANTLAATLKMWTTNVLTDVKLSDVNYNAYMSKKAFPEDSIINNISTKEFVSIIIYINHILTIKPVYILFLFYL